jgi:hypothetical protein
MNWRQLEAIVRAQYQGPVPDVPLALGEAVAWISRDAGKASNVSAIHHHYENRKTFCRLDIPPTKQHLPLLASLEPCKRCAAMSRRALHYAKLSGNFGGMKASA